MNKIFHYDVTNKTETIDGPFMMLQLSKRKPKDSRYVTLQ